MSGRVGGKPTLGESRVPAKLVAECLDEGETADEIAYNYSLPLKLVEDFKAFRDANQLALRR